MREIVAFDFDGTLTRSDSFIRFAVFTRGWFRTAVALVRAVPAIIKWKTGRISSSEVKERLFGLLFGGYDAEAFQDAGCRFAAQITNFQRSETVGLLRQYVARGTEVIIISASMPQWIKPWAKALGVSKIIATEPDIKDGRVTGRFATPNCLGPEKVRRILEVEPQPFRLIAYGDSSGDNELLAFADEAHRI